MTYNARTVLGDCKVALALLEEDLTDERWRVHWAAAVALLRAVGHVLKEVDAISSNPMKHAIRKQFTKWMEDESDPHIFRDFIKRERDSILKEYKSDVHPSSEAHVALLVTLENPITGEQVQVPFSDIFEQNIYRPIIDGPYEGYEAREILEAAIKWWEVELDSIDSEARLLDQHNKA